MVVRKSKKRVHISIPIELHEEFTSLLEKHEIDRRLLSTLVTISLPEWMHAIDKFLVEDITGNRESDHKIKGVLQSLK